MPISLFDANFYRASNSDLAGYSDAQAQAHFQQYGLNEGRSFSAFVNLALYRASNPDLGSFSNQQLLDHLQTYGVQEQRQFSEFVDLGFYQLSNRDLASFGGEQLLEHLQRFGVNEGRSFSPFVNLNFYRSNNGDLAGMSNRQLLEHLKVYGIQEGRRFSEFVDLSFYRSGNPDLSSFTFAQALTHLAVFGLKEGRQFCPAFDANDYRSLNADLAALGPSNLQLLQHFEIYGVSEGRISASRFNNPVYLANNPDLQAAGFGYQEALQHFVTFGNSEGRSGSDYAGHNLAAARGIASTNTTIDFVGLGDSDDFYRFVISTSTNFSAALTRLTANADLQVLNSNGGVIQAANAAGNTSEAIALTLNPGTYYLRVYPGSANQSTNYLLSTAAATPQSTGTMALGQNLFTVGESGGAVSVSVVRTGGSAGVATVDYTTVDSTALAGQDYTFTRGTVTFADGETSKTVTVPILNDGVVEASELFNFALNAASGAALGAPRTATITIVDDDDVATIDFAQPNFNINENSGTATVTLRRSGNTSSASSVTVTASNGTALVGADYTAASGTVSFAIGETSKTFGVTILDDTLAERNETLNVTLSNAAGAVLIAQTTSTVTIIDNDPGNFVREVVVSGLTQPTAFDWSPDGTRLYVAEKDGRVRVAVNGVLSPTAFLDISSQVNSSRDRGLLGIAVHPDFINNPYIYLTFTYDPPEAASGTGLAARDESGNRPSRLVRVTADAATNYTTAVAGSEVVLLGKNSTWANISRPDADSTNDFSIAPSGVLNYGTPQQTNLQDYLATDNQAHTIGTVKFARDGSLFVSNADGASYGNVDPRAARTLDIDNLSGKVLRINPLTGAGLADNPFYDGDPNSNRSKVYNYGMRNPFRFTFNPTTGEPVIGDVGWNAWEEINTGRGKNFGWPYYEGGNGTNLPTGGYSDLPEAQAYYVGGQVVTPSIYSLAHPEAVALIMGDYYTGTTFPVSYDGALFVTDLEEGNVDALFFDQNNQLIDTQRFASGLPYIVQITMGKDSNLYYVNLVDGEVGRWRYA